MRGACSQPPEVSGYVGILSVELHFPHTGSLKAKRKHVLSAKAQLQNAGFKVGTTKYGSSDGYDEDVVIRQDPADKTPAPAGSAVNLTINE